MSANLYPVSAHAFTELSDAGARAAVRITATDPHGTQVIRHYYADASFQDFEAEADTGIEHTVPRFSSLWVERTLSDAWQWIGAEARSFLKSGSRISAELLHTKTRWL